MKLLPVSTKINSLYQKIISPSKPKVTGLLPNAWKKSPSTGLTASQLIDLILKNL
jgi:hypothetical protein